MNTEKLIEKALTNMVGELADYDRAQAFALIAIAQELKRGNDLKAVEVEPPLPPPFPYDPALGW